MINCPSSIADVDFFRDAALVADPYPMLARMRAESPVLREPTQGVLVVTGYDEVLAVVGDHESFSSCNTVTGPFPGFPVSLEGRGGPAVSELIDRHRTELPFSDQLPSFDPPTHTAHRSLLARLITPKRLKENEEFVWRLADQVLRPMWPAAAVSSSPMWAIPLRCSSLRTCWGCPKRTAPNSPRFSPGRYRWVARPVPRWTTPR